MPDSGLRFKKILSWILPALLLACGCDLLRDNPLDPKNPESARLRKTMIEAFVNMETGSPYDAFMTAALDTLARLYPDEVAVAEYYRNVQNFRTPHHLSGNEILYDLYLGTMNTGAKGVPDVFINGTAARIQGASSVETALFRLQQIIQPLISEMTYFSVELSCTILNNQIVPEISLARLGESDAENLLVKVVLTSKIDALHRRVVKASVKSQRIVRLNHGKIQKISLSPMQAVLSGENELIAQVCNQEETVIYQSETLRVRP